MPDACCLPDEFDMTSNAIPTLFEDDLPGKAGGESLYSGHSNPGCMFALSHTGRRVTGTVRIVAGPQNPNGCNPFGARECRVDVTSPKSRDWSDARSAAAMRIAGHWHTAIGNLDVINKALLSHIIQRLKAGRKEAALHIAVREYAASDWHREEKRWMLPGRFFKNDDHVALWIRKSAEWKNHIARRFAAEDQARQSRARKEAAGRTAEPSRGRKGVVGRGATATPHHPAILSDADLRDEYRRVLADRQAEQAAFAYWAGCRDGMYSRAWDSLSESERSRIYGEVEAKLATGAVRRDGTRKVDPSTPRFIFELHRRAWHVTQSGDRKARAEFAIPEHRVPTPTARARPDLVDSEVRKRACAGVTYPSQPRVRWTDAQRRIVAEAEQQFMEEWMEPGA